MPDSSENFIFSVSTGDSVDQLADLTKAEDRAAESLGRWVDAQGRLRDANGRFVSAAQQAAEATRGVADASDRAADKVDKVEPAARRGGKAARDLGGGFLELSRAVEDAQYGLNGVINNVPNMVTRFGGTAGAAAAISLTAVAVNMLLPRLKELGEILKEAAPDLLADRYKELERTIEELSKKPLLLRVEKVQLEEARKELDALKRGLAEWEAQQKRQNLKESESGKLVQEALDESRTGAAGIEDKGVASIRGRDEARSVTIPLQRAAQEAARADLARAKAALAVARDHDDQLAAIEAGGKAQAKLDAAILAEQDARNKIADAAKLEYGAIVERARNGHGREQAEAQERLAGLLNRVGEKDVARLIAGSGVRDIEAGDADVRAAERFGERAARAGAGRRRRAAAAAREQAQRVGLANAGADAWLKSPDGRAFLARQKLDAERAERARPKDEKPEKLEPTPAPEQARKNALDRQRESFAREILRRSRGELDAGQADEAAAEAQKAIQGMGRMGQAQGVVNQAIMVAMRNQYAAMQQHWLMLQQQANGFGQIAGQFAAHQGTAQNGMGAGW